MQSCMCKNKNNSAQESKQKLKQNNSKSKKERKKDLCAFPNWKQQQILDYVYGVQRRDIKRDCEKLITRRESAKKNNKVKKK